MQVLEVREKQVWEAAIAAYPEANFLQSWQWGVFQERMGKTVLRLQLQALPKMGLATLVIEHAKRGTYAALAGGPLLDWQDSDFVSAFFEEVVLVAQRYNCSFLRFRPQELESRLAPKMLEKIGARLAPMHLTADVTLQLDLTKTEEQLLSEMRKSTRYEIKKSSKLGITTEVSCDPVQIQAFYREQLLVAQRHGFVPFSEKFLQTQFEAFVAEDQVALIHSYMQGTLLATAFVIFYNGEAVYHYGVSTGANARLPGAYATQWRAIQEARTRGCTRYNFWGIAPEGAVQHRFAGVSLFKRGFGGSEVAYLPAHDIVISPQYWVTWFFEMIRKKLRHL
jgi:lipid II:glycine glycyltransferase (peptidoglycan interpeptide bridge formation enzyme)